MYGQIYVLGQICTPYMSVLKKTFNLVQFFSPQKQTWTPVSGCECSGFSIQCLNTTGPWIWKASCNLWVTASHSCQVLSLSPKEGCKFLQFVFVIWKLFFLLRISLICYLQFMSHRKSQLPYQALSPPPKVCCKFLQLVICVLQILFLFSYLQFCNF